MECTPRRTLSSVIILILSVKVVCCQNVIQAGQAPLPYANKEVYRDYTNAVPQTTNSNFMNSLYSFGASNGALPDLTTTVDTTSGFNDNSRITVSLGQNNGQSAPFLSPSVTTYTQGPTQPQYPLPQDTFTSLNNLPLGFSAPIIPGYTVSQGYNPVPINNISPGYVSSYNNNIPQSTLFAPTKPVAEAQVIQDNPVTIEQPIESVEVAAELESTDSVGMTMTNPWFETQPAVTNGYGPQPITLQINMPAPIIPEPQITVINNPASVESSSEDLFGYPSFQNFQMPPIIVQRSKNNNWLPILLIALLDGGRQGGGCGGSCGCGCCCNCGSSNIPIPYPIPISTYNPIVLTR